MNVVIQDKAKIAVPIDEKQLVTRSQKEKREEQATLLKSQVDKHKKVLSKLAK